eukprot:342439-Pleurochrysis_carterae.AAC.1
MNAMIPAVQDRDNCLLEKTELVPLRGHQGAVCTVSMRKTRTHSRRGRGDARHAELSSVTNCCRRLAGSCKAAAGAASASELSLSSA